MHKVIESKLLASKEDFDQLRAWEQVAGESRSKNLFERYYYLEQFTALGKLAGKRRIKLPKQYSDGRLYLVCNAENIVPNEWRTHQTLFNVGFSGELSVNNSLSVWGLVLSQFEVYTYADRWLNHYNMPQTDDDSLMCNKFISDVINAC